MAAIEKLYRGMLAAWEMLIDAPPPEVLRGVAERSKGGVSAAFRLAGFPLLGLMFGVLLGLAGSFLVRVFHPAGGALAFAVVALLLLEWKDGGRSLGLTTSVLTLRRRGLAWDEALERMNPDLNALTSPLSAAVLTLLEIVKAAMLFLVCFGHANAWLVIVLAGGFAVQGALAGLPEEGSGRPFLEISEGSRNRVLGWVVGVICVVWMCFFPFGALMAGLAIWGMIVGFSRYFDRNFGGVSAEMITLAGSAAEFLLLLIGILFAIRI